MRTIVSLTTLTAFIALAYFSQQNIVPAPSKALKSKDLYSKTKTPKRYDQPSEAAAWLATMRRAPEGTNAAQLNLANLKQIKNARANKANQELPALAFEELGPGVFGGRIRGFVIHPERAGHLLAGGVLGGVWKSTDDGQSWEAKTDFLENIAIGSLLLDPDDSEKVYIGTGEGFFNFDAAQGNGIFVSEDFGESWQRFGNTDSENFYYVNRMAKIPNSNVFLAATATGIFRSTDSGQNWTEVSNHNTSGRGFVDLKLDPANPAHLLASHFGIPNDVLTVDITTANNISGSNIAIPASFGPDFPENGISNTLATASYGSNNLNGCQAITSDVSNKIAVMQRGSCNFTDKVKNAQNAGAIAAIVVQSSSEDAFVMGGDDDTINIPSAMVNKDFGDGILLSTTALQANVGPSLLDPLERFVMRSTNQGQNWQILDQSDGLPESGVERIEIGFGTDGTSYLAVSTETVELDNGGTEGTLGLWKSQAPNHVSYSKTTSNTQFVERQGWYDLAIAVNPNDSDHVVMGAVDQYATTNGGTTINQKSYWSPQAGQVPQYIHADHHGYFFSPHNSDHIYAVSDGGVSKSEDGGTTWVALNNGLNISQSYGIAVSPDGQRVTSGTQDNGSQLYFGDQQTWLEWQGGDGGYSGWDQQQGQYVYGSYVNGQMYGSNNGGLSAAAMELPDTDGARFIQPFVLDENNGNRMLVGTDNVFFTNNARFLSNATWQDVSDSINGSGVSALAFNPHQSTVAYAGMSSSDSLGTNQIVKISGLGTANTVTDISPIRGLAVFGDVVTDIKVDTFDTSGNTLYATFGDYEKNRILKSTDGGNSWSSIANNLPKIPLYQILNDPSDADMLYLGSELGLWVGQKSGSTYQWTQFDYGPASSRVIDLVWNNDELYIGTHGRGTFKASKNPIAVSLVKFLTTDSSCDDDGILDRGEAGKLMVSVTNNSGKNFNNVALSFNQPSSISFTDANQSFSLAGFAQKTIALNSRLDNQASCLADVTIPLTITTSEGSYNSAVTVKTSANQSFVKHNFTDGAESADSLMKSELALGNDGWIRVTDSVNSGSRSWFTTNEDAYSDKSLLTPWMTFDGGGNVLEFAMSYNTEGSNQQHWDGLVLEMKLEGTDNWFDIGHLSTVAYDGPLYTNNTAQAQFAWSGSQLAWRETSVNLGTQYVGQTAQIRFRMVSDTNTSIEGFWLDDISVSNVITQTDAVCDECVSTTNNKIPTKGLWYDPAHDGHGFIVEAVGANDLYYTLFYTYDDAGNPEWLNSVTSLANGVLNQSFDANTLSKFIYDYDVDPNVADPFFADNSITEGRLSIDFNSSEVQNHPACQDGVSRPLQTVALATWRINNVTESWCIVPIIADEAKPDPDFGTGWWGGQAENGWGYSLAQTGDVMIAYVFYYDADGNARWATGSAGGFAPNKDITIPMFDVNAYGRTATPVPFTLTSSGTVTLNLANTFRDLDTDGSTTIDVTYQGSEGGRWFRENIKIMNLLQEH
ncbi:PA domain-containing protein [Marinicella litoralis]|uniref:PA domain-containing protein n=1 Tax=Marinicella litoralis TaxID=644220 RepID=A0A4V3DIW8_9GAMM|nr:PA domain-containing protein [Marinicella litoralis]TDR23411.1 PA domain-containing protein [Marinicella litoralis]